MRPLDIAFMKAVHHKVNIVPVIAKADTLTKKEVLNLKRRVSKIDVPCKIRKVVDIMLQNGCHLVAEI